MMRAKFNDTISTTDELSPTLDPPRLVKRRQLVLWDSDRCERLGN